jgi:hypothetical protein
MRYRQIVRSLRQGAIECVDLASGQQRRRQQMSVDPTEPKAIQPMIGDQGHRLISRRRFDSREQL